LFLKGRPQLITCLLLPLFCEELVRSRCQVKLPLLSWGESLLPQVNCKIWCVINITINAPSQFDWNIDNELACFGERNIIQKIFSRWNSLLNWSMKCEWVPFVALN
jgi:hypothetical protein